MSDKKCHSYGRENPRGRPRKLPDELEVLPELLEEAVVVPLVVGRDGHAVRDVADDVQLLDRYLVDLVQQVDAGDVRPVALHHVDQVVGCGVAPQSDVRVVDPVDKVRIN